MRQAEGLLNTYVNYVRETKLEKKNKKNYISFDKFHMLFTD